MRDESWDFLPWIRLFLRKTQTLDSSIKFGLQRLTLCSSIVKVFSFLCAQRLFGGVCEKVFFFLFFSRERGDLVLWEEVLAVLAVRERLLLRDCNSIEPRDSWRSCDYYAELPSGHGEHHHQGILEEGRVNGKKMLQDSSRERPAVSSSHAALFPRLTKKGRSFMRLDYTITTRDFSFPDSIWTSSRLRSRSRQFIQWQDIASQRYCQKREIVQEILSRIPLKSQKHEKDQNLHKNEWPKRMSNNLRKNQRPFEDPLDTHTSKRSWSKNCQADRMAHHF